ncbi:protein GRAVITROPIC IN THE LIGHT 1-like [Juglans microcarpa x Juglans regia]|uniref:protein GRAVITROPIC IN THE LIGHT 1-like n=1 Tax=Juglans microcarpa x Juglans regia TaxID=2249226 RepID=UPI001B7DF737|nr:protein GRAVITROPIC IN THE LIGHT 1-like [Juglans microcarpa x Juglans regia]
MDTLTPKSALNSKNKLARTFQKVINLRTSNNGICMLTSQSNVKEDSFPDRNSQQFDKNDIDARGRQQRAVLEALVAKLFAGITSIKAAYAELQMAQNPYNCEAIQVADQTVVDELKAISELKRSFLRKELDLSPQVTLMLAEVQEQQGLMKTYEITIKKLKTEADLKDSNITSLQNQLDNSNSLNKRLYKRLNSSGSLSMFDNLRLTVLNVTHFVQFLHYTLRSIRSFVKLMIRKMDSAHWDLDAAVKFIEPDAVFTNPSHRFFAFESFVNISMFQGFNCPQFQPSDHSQQQPPLETHRNRLFFDKFKKLTNVNPRHFLSHNPNSSFAKFTRAKYLHLVHAKMECSLFGNLNQRKLVNSGGVPDSSFFVAFAEMAKRVWLLHCLAFSFDEEVSIFQVRKNCRYSEVYMECVAEEGSFYSGEIAGGNGGGEPSVGFTVVPGFKIGKTVIQSQVYLSPATTTPASR